MTEIFPNVFAERLKKLNRQQRGAVTHGLKKGRINDLDPLLVIAGAGTGKTKTLAHRVAHLVANGMDPRRILLLTFSRRAAEEMSNRVRRIIEAIPSDSHTKLPWSGTFHAMGARLIGEYAKHIGLNRSFTIIDQPDAADLMTRIQVASA